MGRPNLKLRAAVYQIRRTGRIFRGRWVHIRVGVSPREQTLISVRRKFGNAVARNRIRRQLRAISADLISSGHPGQLLLISVGDRSRSATFQKLSQELQTGFDTLGLLDS